MKKRGCKTKVTKSIMPSVITLLAIAVVGLTCSLIQSQKKLQDTQVAVSNLGWVQMERGWYREFNVSEDRGFFLLPELEIKFPYSAAAAFQEHGKVPRYTITNYSDPAETERAETWTVNISYLEEYKFSDIGDTSMNMTFAPLTLFYDESADYAVGDDFRETSLANAEQDNKIADIVRLEDGRTIYIVVSNREDYVNDFEEYKLQNMLGALREMRSY